MYNGQPPWSARLPGAQVDRDPAFERLTDLAEEVLEKDVFCGNRGIGLEIEDPEAIVSGSDWAKIRLRRRGLPCRGEPVLEPLMSV
jgi:hypothetical protein